MSTESARKLMKSTFYANPELPAEYIRAAYNLAQRSADKDFLITLMGRNDTPSDLYEIYRKDKRPEFRAAFLLRPGLGQEEMREMLQDETRAGVLSSVLRNFKGDYSITPLIESVFLAKPSKALAELLIKSENPTVLLEALKIYGENFNKANSAAVHRCFVALRSLIESKEQDPNFLASELNHGVYLQELLNQKGTELNAKSVRIALELCKENLFGEGAVASLSQRYGNERSHEQKALVLSLEKMLEVARNDDILRFLEDDGEKVWQPEAQGRIERTLALHGRAREGEVFDLSNPGGRLRAAALVGADQQDLLKRLIEAALEEQDGTIVGMLLTNPALEPGQVERLIQSPVIDKVERRVMSSIALTHKDDLELVTFFYSRGLNVILEEIGYAAWPDVKTAQSMILKKLEEDYLQNKNLNGGWHAESNWRYGVETLANHSEVDMDHFLSLLPWSYLEKNGGGRSILKELARRQVEILGTEPDAWETFAVLATNFTGTVQELLESAKALS